MTYDETINPDSVEATFTAGSYRGVCGVCGKRTKKMGSEQKALTAIADHRRDEHSEEQ
jgi:hypothetical protein